MTKHFILKSFDGSIDWGEIGRKSAKIITASFFNGICLAVMLLTIDKIFCAFLVKSSSHALIFPIFAVSLLLSSAYILLSSALKICVSRAEMSSEILVVRAEISLEIFCQRNCHMVTIPMSIAEITNKKTAVKAKSGLLSEELNNVKLDMI